MKPRIFGMLFICNAIPLFIGMGLFPLLPLYAARFGATSTDIGIYYALVYIASTASVLITGWLATHIAPRRLFLAGATLGAPTMALMAHATTLWQVELLTALAWFSGGVTLTLLNVFTGALAAPASRGRIFSLMFLVYPLDSLIGGATIGHLTATYSYATMFYVLAGLWVFQPLIGLFGLRNVRIAASSPNVDESQSSRPLGRAFIMLLISSLLANTCISIGRLGVSLAMQVTGFSADAIASTAMAAGLVTIPLALGIGALSDRVGRKHILTLSFLLGAAGAGVLCFASGVWQFRLAATLLLAAWCVSRAVAAAFGADLLPREALGRGLARLGSTDSIASVAGFAASGFIMETFGVPALFGIATILGLTAAIGMRLVPARHDTLTSETASALVMERDGAIVPLPQARNT